MDFRSLETEKAFLRLRTSGDETILAYIDGRGPDPHSFIIAKEGLDELLSLPDNQGVEILDKDNKGYDEGFRPPFISLGSVREELRRQNLTAYSSYEDYRQVQVWSKTNPLPVWQEE